MGLGNVWFEAQRAYVPSFEPGLEAFDVKDVFARQVTDPISIVDVGETNGACMVIDEIVIIQWRCYEHAGRVKDCRFQ